MKKLLLLLIAGLFVFDVQASVVKQLYINALLHPDGSASIEEYWLIDLDKEDAKTEWYVAHRGLNGMRIENLTVEGYVPGYEDPMVFETLDNWDVDASREEKAGRCGLNNNGQEICWGFGDWGEHEYIVSYELKHLVRSYDTCDGFNHCFVDMNCTVKEACVTIAASDNIALSEENTRRWAFGYEGRIEFDGNNIVATPNEEIGHGKRMIIMLEMDKGMFDPDTKGGEPWADKKQRALDGSDFASSDDEDLSFWDWVLIILFIIVCTIGYFCASFIADWTGGVLAGLLWILLCVAWWVLSLSPLRTWRRRKKLGIAKGRYFRDVKDEWTLINNKMVMDDLSYFTGMSNEHIIGAILLKLMARGDLTIVREVFKGKEHDMLKIVKPVTEVDNETKGDDRLCSHAMKLLTLAAGDDLILQPNEFQKWCKVKKHSTEIKNFLDLMDTKYDKTYITKHAADLYGMKAFLKDFSLLNERGMMEVGLWDKYMVYAEFFGLADKVRAEMSRICPEYLKMSKLGQSLDVAQEDDIVYMFSDSIYTSASSAIQRAAEKSRSSGFSSFSSSGGGGGYSGGGGGGGR